jgi:hypothetical protein
MKKFLEWWILLLIQISGLGLCYYFDLFEWVWENDATKLSFLILAIWIVMTIKCGINAIAYDKLATLNGGFIKTRTRERLDAKLESGWFASDQCLTIGMLGTVIGFLLMMSSLAMNNADVEAIQSMLKTMSTGMSTALITTAIGMIFGNLLKLQLFLISRET